MSVWAPEWAAFRAGTAQLICLALLFVSSCTYAKDKLRAGLVAQGAAASVAESTKDATEVEFDTSILRQLGLDPSLASYFSKAPRFYPGPNIVAVTLNGSELGRKNAIFNREGLLCFDEAFVRSIGLKPITTADAKKADGQITNACPQYSDISPRTVVTLKPLDSAVDIVTPQEFVQETKPVVSVQGGVGAMLNYRASFMESDFGDSSGGSGYRQLDSTVGFNANDWIFRSQQTYSAQRSVNLSTSQLLHRSIYGQKTFTEHRRVLQGGRIYVQDPMFGGTPIVGAQWVPELAMVSQSGFAVTGMANSRARVEISQNGVLLHSTVVPSGAFRISGFPINNRSVDLQVKVTEENGSQQTSVVPAASLLLAAEHDAVVGLSVATGQLWDASGSGNLENAPLLTASQGWYYGDRMSGIAGLQLSTNYVASGVGLNTRLWRSGPSAYMQLVASNDINHNRSGAMGSAALGFAASEKLNFGMSGNLRDKNYVSLEQAKALQIIQPNLSGTRAQLGGNVSFNAGAIGSFSANMVRQFSFNGDSADMYSASWSIPVFRAQLGLTFTHSPARYVSNAVSGEVTLQPKNTSIYASLAFPLFAGANSSSAISRTNSGGVDVTRRSTSVDQKVNDYFSYRASVDSVESPSNAANTNTSFSASMLPKYTSLSLGVSQGVGSSTYYGEASGGVVIHKDGVGFSPSPIQDSFGLVKVGDLTGARLNTPSGAVWTGLNGVAAIPSLTPFQKSQVELDTAAFPEGIDVDNGYQSVQAGRGAVLKMDIKVSRVRRLLMTLARPDGQPLPIGALILRGDGEYVAPVLSGGRVFVGNYLEGQNYVADLGESKQCTFSNIKFVPRVEGEQFERATAQCI
jgi:outer membrane usher protein FimD/PapC